jgi:exodeoxyribonuclease V
MTFNTQQEVAAEKFLRWWETERWERDFLLYGLPGTGKTWLLQKLTELVRCRTLYCAPTGKAARVVAHRTGKPAITVHRLMYRPTSQVADEIRERMGELHSGLHGSNVHKPEGGFLTVAEIEAEMEVLRGQLEAIKKDGNSVKFTFKLPEPDLADLLSIDEGSMVGSVMGNDLKKVRIPKIISGDPMQLPPVKDTWAYQGIKPDVFLTEIMRQGAGSGIPKACADNLAKRPLVPYEPDFLMPKRGTIGLDQYAQFDMILVGKNEIRKRINRSFREFLGYGDELLVVGEKLLALNNQENGISNGELLTVTNIVSDMGSKYILDLVDVYGNFFPSVEAWKGTLRKDEGSMEAPRTVGQFCYGYAITVHKSQGSEGAKVLLLNSWGEDKPDYRRWLNTGISRASQQCVFVR